MPYPKRDSSGERYGRLVVVGDAPRGDNTKHRWVACRCDCGNDYNVRYTTLRSGVTRSCGCLQRENLTAVHQARQKDLVGRQFGRLRVIAKAASRKLGTKWHGYWLCLCECGNETTVQRAALTSRSTKSCGCWYREQASVRARKHGAAGSSNDARWPEYLIWGAIIQRCTNPKNPAYADYGGRGITVCDRWRRFENFIEDVGRRPEYGMQLDRTDNNKGYSPDNCRWVTREANMQNRSFVTREEGDELKRRLAAYEAAYGPLKPDADE